MEDAFAEFDREIDRRGVAGQKWSRYDGREIIPMWVADMDFGAPPAVVEALRGRLEHAVFGYTDPWPSLESAIVDGLGRDHGWQIDAEWLVWLPGTVSGLNLACRAVGHDGDGVFTAAPIYPPFLGAPANNRRKLQRADLVPRGDRWEWDFPAVEAAIDASTRLFLLCNPHNPLGRVFERDELQRIANLCAERDLVLCSDEIHCGLVLDPQRPHLPVASLGDEVAARTITLMAPSKTWNIPALYCAFAVIPEPGLRRRFRHAMRGLVPPTNLLGMVAAEVAYRDCEDWRRRLIAYLRRNRDDLASALGPVDEITVYLPEATYLAWIDCRRLAGLGISEPHAFFEEAGVALSDGRAFGAPGFLRLNFGCTRRTLGEALKRMLAALRGAGTANAG